MLITSGWLMQCWYVRTVTKGEEGLYCAEAGQVREKGRVKSKQQHREGAPPVHNLRLYMKDLCGDALKVFTGLQNGGTFTHPL